jgi:hypothetical protein
MPLQIFRLSHYSGSAMRMEYLMNEAEKPARWVMGKLGFERMTGFQ